MGEEVTLTWFGHSMFLAEDSRVKLVTDPFDEKVGYPLPEVQADVVLVSHEHFDHNNVSLVKGFRHALRDTEPFSMGTVKIEGCPSYHDDAGGQIRGDNIIFKWRISGITFVHMGDYGETRLSKDQDEFISAADVLMIPVGGVYTIESQRAKEIIELIKPSIVIPMHYKTKHCNIDIKELSDFLTDAENFIFSPSSVTISAENLPEETEIWVLEPCFV